MPTAPGRHAAVLCSILGEVNIIIFISMNVYQAPMYFVVILVNNLKLSVNMEKRMSKRK